MLIKAEAILREPSFHIRCKWFVFLVFRIHYFQDLLCYKPFPQNYKTKNHLIKALFHIQTLQNNKKSKKRIFETHCWLLNVHAFDLTHHGQLRFLCKSWHQCSATELLLLQRFSVALVVECWNYFLNVPSVISTKQYKNLKETTRKHMCFLIVLSCFVLLYTDDSLELDGPFVVINYCFSLLKI